jgi:predicted RNase H-like nuclease (RuvC/YqgF family)
MNKSYLIVPAVLLVIFGFVYNGALKEMKAKEEAKQELVAKNKAEDAARKKSIEDKSTAEAKKRQEEREAADLAKEQKKTREYEDALKKLRDETQDYNTQADKLAKEAADLEIRISQGRSDREKLNSETLDLAKQVELAKINRRTAELEIQRLMEMVAKKLNDSSIAVGPPPPPVVVK